MQRYRKLPKPSLGDYILQVIFNLQSDFPGTEFFGAETFLKEEQSIMEFLKRLLWN